MKKIESLSLLRRLFFDKMYKIQKANLFPNNRLLKSDHNQGSHCPNNDQIDNLEIIQSNIINYANWAIKSHRLCKLVNKM